MKEKIKMSSAAAVISTLRDNSCTCKKKNEQDHRSTNNMACAHSKDSDQLDSCSMISFSSITARKAAIKNTAED